MKEFRVPSNTILITGGAGFVGSSLALGLKQRHPSAKIIAFDNLKRRGSELNIARLQQQEIEFIHGDIRQPSDLEDIENVSLIIECSAEPSVLAGYHSSPRYVIDTNLGGTINCLELARKHKAGVIFLSSSRVYPIETLNAIEQEEHDARLSIAEDQSIPGVSPQGITEAFPLEGTRSMYGASKLSSELIFREYMAIYDIPGVINRCGVLTGPWQMGKVDQGVVVLWAARHLYGGPLSYVGYGGQGKQVRDILHVNDLLNLVLHQIDNLESLTGQLFNVGGGLDVSISLAELTTLCEQSTGNTITIDSVQETRDADIPIFITDNTKVTRETGWKPNITPDQIVEEIVQWLRDNEATLRPILK